MLAPWGQKPLRASVFARLSASGETRHANSASGSTGEISLCAATSSLQHAARAAVRSAGAGTLARSGLRSRAAPATPEGKLFDQRIGRCGNVLIERCNLIAKVLKVGDLKQRLETARAILRARREHITSVCCARTGARGQRHVLWAPPGRPARLGVGCFAWRCQQRCGAMDQCRRLLVERVEAFIDTVDLP